MPHSEHSRSQRPRRPRRPRQPRRRLQTKGNPQPSMSAPSLSSEHGSYPGPLSDFHPSAQIYITRKAADNLYPRELRECYALVRKLKPLYDAAGDPWNRHAKLAEMSKTPHLEYFLCRLSNAGPVLAYLSAVLDDVDDHGAPTTFVYEIHVDATLHGKGIGRRLIDMALRESPAQKLTLRTFALNKNACRFYDRLGFKKDPIISTPQILFLDLSRGQLRPNRAYDKTHSRSSDESNDQSDHSDHSDPGKSSAPPPAPGHDFGVHDTTKSSLASS